MFRILASLIGGTFRIWAEAKASRMSAAMTYYTMLSLAPLLTMSIAIAGLFFGQTVAEQEIVDQVKLFASDAIAQTVGSLIKNAVHPESGIIAGSISIAVLIFAASGVFTQLQETFNEIWQVPREQTSSVLYKIRQRFMGIAMVLVVGMALLIALAINSVLGGFAQMITESYPRTGRWLNLLEVTISYGLLPLTFSLMFWLIPSKRVRWRDAWPAGIVTSGLVAVSRYLIKLYLQFSSTSEIYGAAGSLVVLLVWVYVTGMMVFFGAAMSRSWHDTFGSPEDPAASDETSAASDETSE